MEIVYLRKTIDLLIVSLAILSRFKIITRLVLSQELNVIVPKKLLSSGTLFQTYFPNVFKSTYQARQCLTTQCLVAGTSSAESTARPATVAAIALSIKSRGECPLPPHCIARSCTWCTHHPLQLCQHVIQFRNVQCNILLFFSCKIGVNTLKGRSHRVVLDNIDFSSTPRYVKKLANL